MKRFIAVIGFCLLACLEPALALEVPYLTGRVQDNAGLLSSEARGRITASLESLETQTGAQLAVLTLASLEGEPLEDFSIRVVETWELGRKGVDDGVLLLVSRDDRKIRIEVGYGLEGVLPDAASGRVIDQLIKPRFREGDFDRGIEEATLALAGAIRGQEDAIPPQALTSTAGEQGGSWVFLAFFGMMVLPFVQAAGRVKGTPGWSLFIFLIPFFFFFSLALGLRIALFVTVAYVLGVGLFRIFLPERMRLDPESTFKSSGGRSGRSGGGWWGSGGWGGGGSGGFSGGGGGFSGGGGSFGGGGASGGW